MNQSRQSTQRMFKQEDNVSEEMELKMVYW